MKDINEIEVPLINDTYQIREVNVSNLRFWTKKNINVWYKIMPSIFVWVGNVHQIIVNLN